MKTYQIKAEKNPDINTEYTIWEYDNETNVKQIVCECYYLHQAERIYSALIFLDNSLNIIRSIKNIFS